MKKTFILVICVFIMQSFLFAQSGNTKITDQNIGDVQIRKRINKLKNSHKEWMIKQEVRMINNDKATVYKVFEAGKLIFEIEPTFNRKTMKYTDKIDRITTYSSKYKTSTGIGVGATLHDVLTKYINHQIIKDPNGNFLVSSSDEYISFMIDPKSYIGAKAKLTDGTTSFLQEDFSAAAKIMAIRIFDVPDGEVN